MSVKKIVFELVFPQQKATLAGEALIGYQILCICNQGNREKGFVKGVENLRLKECLADKSPICNDRKMKSGMKDQMKAMKAIWASIMKEKQNKSRTHDEKTARE